MPTAITYSEFGGPEVLTVSEVGIPEPAPDQVRVRVRAAGINPLDIKIRRGDMAGAFPVTFPVTPGLDAAGVVDAVGDAVTGVAPGDGVFGAATGGSYAEYAVMPAPVKKPKGLSWELAAALPTVGETAFRALKHLDVHAGQVLLVHGAGGSVGTIAVQLAVARGATVIGTAGETDLDRVTGLGATALRYGDNLVERVRAVAPDGVDRVFDTSGAGVLPASVELAGDPEHVITIADGSAARLGVRFTGADPADRTPEALPELAELAASGDLTLPIWRTYPLDRAAQAHADIEAHRNHGKIILLP
ncbi:NADP-dependent oxidoreductase [Streptomyces sp. NPDC002004]